MSAVCKTQIKEKIMGDYSKFIDEKRRAVPTPESMVDENGICAFGTFDKEFEKWTL